MRPVFLEITVVTAQRTPIPKQTLEVAPAERVVAVVQRLLDRLGSKSWPGDWNLLHQGARLPLDGTIGALVPERTTVVPLVLCSDSCDISLPLPTFPGPTAAAPDDSGVDLAFEDDADEPEEAPARAPTRGVNEEVSLAEAAEVTAAAVTAAAPLPPPEVKPGTSDDRDDDLRRIVALKDSDAEAAAAKLLELLTAHPEYKAAWLQYAHWHFETEDYEAASEGFEKALALGTAKSPDYVRAALSASRLGRYRQALDMLHGAEKALPPGQVDGVVFFNMGCYHARLGQLDEVVPCLRRAVAAGCRSLESFLQDEDLAPVRNRPDFKKLVAELR
jgi:hypothetical protein